MNPLNELDPNNVTAIAQLADQRTQFNPDFHGLPVIAAHEAIKLTTYAHLLPAPMRVKRAITLDTAQQLTAYLDEVIAAARVANPKQKLYPVIFADAATRSFTLYPKFHHGHDLSWLDHKVTSHLNLSREMKLWLKHDGSRFTQEAFADFVEENNVDIHTPTGAAMLTIAKTLQATRTEVFRSSVKVSDGTHRFTWDNQASGEENTEVPDEFHLAIPIFDGDEEVIRVKARLFHRLPTKENAHLQGSGLTFFYKLHRLDDILEKIWDERINLLRAAVAGRAQVYNGTYEGSNIA